MYAYVWDPETHGYLLKTEAGKYVANEIRPVFAEELKLTGMSDRFDYDPKEKYPLLWAQKNYYFFNGEKVAQLNGTRYGTPLNVEYFFDGKKKLQALEVDAFVEKNAGIMELVVVDAKRRAKELFDQGANKSDVSYVAFSGGKDSVVTLDICHRVLPLSAPVIYSDTGMDLPASLDVWKDVQLKYPEREFIKIQAKTSALENWERFGPPSQYIRWCCSVLKSSPVIAFLREKLNKPDVRTNAFVGVRSDESAARSEYEDFRIGVKNASQINSSPILDWSAHELWLYIFAEDLIINPVYRFGLPRVGCLICPESSNKHLWYVSQIYPELTKPYVDVVLRTSKQTLTTEKEKADFFVDSIWRQRKGGVLSVDMISAPIEKTEGLKVSFKSPHFREKLFFEWIKTLGTVLKDDSNNNWRLKQADSWAASFSYEKYGKYFGGKVEFLFDNQDELIALTPKIRSCLRKASACIGCGSCEAECVYGAISTVAREGVVIDSSKCVHCQKCYDIPYACWRYRSMREQEKAISSSGKINAYQKFGLRENENYAWISSLVKLGESFFPWTSEHPIGKNMVPSARTWFIQCELIDPNDKTPKKLLEIFRRYGGTSVLGWEFIWVALANNSPLIKWFVVDVPNTIPFTMEQLESRLKNYDLSLSDVDVEGGLAAFKDMFTKSPVGLRAETLEMARKKLNVVEDASVAFVEVKGKTSLKIKQIERRSKKVNPLTLLYGLYFIARLSQRSSFTVREMLRADKESTFVSPLVAFGIPSDVFKRQCEGLRTKYPDYISTTFTHGNDEVQVFPDKYGTDDVIDLALSEN